MQMGATFLGMLLINVQKLFWVCKLVCKSYLTGVNRCVKVNFPVKKDMPAKIDTYIQSKGTFVGDITFNFVPQLFSKQSKGNFNPIWSGSNQFQVYKLKQVSCISEDTAEKQ